MKSFKTFFSVEILTLLLVVAAGISIYIQNQSIELQNRAYMFISTIQTFPVSNEKNRMQLVYVIGNSGKTPALNVVTKVAYVHVPDSSLHTAFDMLIKNKYSSKYQPEATFTAGYQDSGIVNVTFTDPGPGESTIAEQFYFIGLIEYRDIYGKQHYTKICHLRFKNFFLPCDKYNEMN